MKLEGEVAEIVLTTRLVELWRERFTGAIRFENDGIIKIIYFKGGDVLSASTNDRADSIDEILLRAGKVTRDHVKQALAKRKESETLGDALLNLGFITRKELAWARRVQVIGVIRSIEGWSRGSYTVVADYLPKREEGTLFPLPQIIVEMIVTDPERARFERALEGGSAVFVKTPEFDEEFSRLGLNDEANRIGAAIDGQRDASDVAVASGQDGFNTFKLLHALAVLGLIQRVTAGGTAMPVAAAPANEFDSMDDGTASWDFNAPVDLGGADSLGPDSLGSTSPGIDSLGTDSFGGDSLGLPSFGADDEVPVAMPVPAAAASAPANPNDYWSMDDEPEVAPSVPAAAAVPSMAGMPAWDTPAKPAETHHDAPAEEEQWGFDEAQIEAARNAAVPVSRKSPLTPPTSGRSAGKGKRFGVIAAIVVAVLALGSGAYYGFVWWQEQQNAELAAASQPVPRPRPVRPASPATTSAAATETIAVPAVDSAAVSTAAPTATAAATATAPASTATTATQAPAPAPIHVTPPPQVALSPVKPARPATTPVPAPAPAAAGDATRSRYDAIARQNAQSAAGNFTVQLVIVCEVSNLEKAIRDGGDKIWYIPVSVKGRSCYRVFWGRYDTRDAATRAIGEVPARLRESRPVAVSVPKG